MAQHKNSRRTILLGVDASEHSERALNWYIKNLCDKDRDDVILVHSQEEPTIPASAGPYDDGSTFYDVYLKEVGKKDRQTKKLLDAFGAKCELYGVKFETYSQENTKPGEVICKLAKDVNANLIVMGSRGMGTLRRTLLGSVSDYCVHHAHIPVAIVPPPNRHGDHARSS